MSKVGAAFGGGGKKKPSHAEILGGLHQAALDKKAAEQIAAATAGGATSASAAKFKKGRAARSARLRKTAGEGGPGVDDENNGSAIKRPGVRTAQLLGS